VTLYVLEMISAPGHYIAPLNRDGVMIFQSMKAAEAFVWKLDALVVLNVKIKPVKVNTPFNQSNIIGPYTA
jgi:hypothetical protein